MASTHEREPSNGQSANRQSANWQSIHGQPTRCYTDDQGISWRVFQQRVEGGTDYLIFESEAAYRRVRAYPPDWRELSSEELTRLSWRR